MKRRQYLILLSVILVIIAGSGMALASLENQNRVRLATQKELAEINATVNHAHKNLEERFSDILPTVKIKAAMTAAGPVFDDKAMESDFTHALLLASKNKILQEGDYVVAWKSNIKSNVLFLGLTNAKDSRLVVIDFGADGQAEIKNILSR